MNHTSFLSRAASAMAAAAAAAIVGAALPAHASLGGDAASVQADILALGARATVSAATGYEDHRLSLPRGLVVHEYVNAAGQVFEVTWSGRGSRPNLAQLLGPHFAKIQATPEQARPTRRHVEIVHDDLVFRSAVRARVFTGTAHLASLLPQGLAQPLAVPVETP